MAENSTLQQVEIDVDGFPIIGAENIVTPTASVLTRDQDVMSFTNPTKTETTATPTDSTIEIPEPKNTGTEQKDLLDSLVNIDNGVEPVVEDDRPTSTGRAKQDKSALVEYIKAKVETKDFVTFDDYDEKTPIDEYLAGLSNKDLNSLVDENLKLKEDKYKEEVPKQFYEALPDDFKLAYEYIANGGQDLKGLYRSLSEVREIKELDPTNETHQEEIVYEYLRNANPDWTATEVKEQVEEWKDLGTIEKKATQLKPKLDAIKAQDVQFRLQEQQEFARQRQEAAETYIGNVYETLKDSDLGGVKIDAKTQSSIYHGLTKANFKSMSGGNTNGLGHLLEKYQYGKDQNYTLIAKAYWLLSDPEGYDNAIAQKAVNKNTEETVRKLKTEQGNRSSSVASDVGGNASRIVTRISKTPANPFKH